MNKNHERVLLGLLESRPTLRTIAQTLRDREPTLMVKVALEAMELVAQKPEPVAMRLACPECHALHIDEGEFATKEHHTHSCQECGMTWRPAVVPTIGVRFLPGFKNEEAIQKEEGPCAAFPDRKTHTPGCGCY